ncbi:replication-relaxation family protein [Alicyclobacillus cycloheptanicus]|uniref:replication-relaxation family protein n=1 Tax=Alicyclobacillus cycloheptanicus TaxID=1457 RepID=UPI00237A07DE|nr:replication-relaxation family protein [Alicyclobacillus cycloheptanicus]
MLEQCNCCSTAHVAQLYAHTTRPMHRAWTVLEHLRQRDYIESWRPAFDHPAVHRLSRRIRRKYDLPLVRWNGRLSHRLAITDVYMTLGMPEDFVTEPRAEFIWQGKHHVLSPDAYTRGMLIEVQRSSMTAEQWKQKRRMYELFFRLGVWEQYFEERPTVVIVQSHEQQLSTIGAAIGYEMRVVRGIREVMPSGDGRDVVNVGEGDR